MIIPIHKIYQGLKPYWRILNIVVVFCFVYPFLQAQNNENLNLLRQDTLLVPSKDTSALLLPSDTLQSVVDTTAQNASGLGIEAEVKYSASDSIVMKGTNQVFLYGDAEVNYQDIKLTAAVIELDLDSSLTFAYGLEDSTGVAKGLPVFTDSQGSYEMKTIRYNFKSEKALIEHVVTEQGEGYVVSSLAKKSPDDSFSIKDGHYSTCDNHEHPHFYLNMTKAKVIPGEKIITGPAYLVIEDVPIYPIGIPFGFVPSTSSYSSGIIMPSYGEEQNRGIFLRDGGYYWAASDYFDLALTGDLYANSSWGSRVASKYKKRYAYSGSLNANYIVNIFSEKDLPDYRKTKDFSLTWSHRQDTKANPFQTFSASVNYSSSSYDQNNVSSIINPTLLATNTKRSSISYSRRFPNLPINFSANLLASQNTRDTTVSLTLPDLTVTMNRIFPFKRKNKIGSKEAWYEKMSLSYTGNIKNYITAKEYDLGDKKFPSQWQNGMRHSVPVSLNLKMLKYFTLTPSFNYTERWYTSSISKKWDEDLNRVVVADTSAGFKRVYDYSYSVSTSTKFYTMFTPWEKLFGDKVQKIRHVMTPSASLSYRPDFGAERYGYYDWIEYYDPNQDSIIRHEYSIYEGALYGSPGRGESGSLGLSIGNTLEMKVKSDRDTLGYKKIKILEGLNFSTSHNFMADSLKWSRINMSGRTKILGTNINFGASFDPYALDTTSRGTPIRINTSHYKATGKLARLESANLNFGVSIGSEKIKKWLEKRRGESSNEDIDADEPPEEEDYVNPLDRIDRVEDEFADTRGTDDGRAEVTDDGYTKFEFPWNLSLNYSFRLVNGEFEKEKMAFKKKVTSDINLNGDFSLTPKWKFSFSSGYNFDMKKISHTNLRISRDLHCWGMSFNLVPVGRYKSYFFSLRVNSSILQDLKYDKRSSARDNASFF
ncbi:LPS assembly outer membrane protein LptD (organic solvent tolerance protein OstA) [Saccharicrinis carchari]|uniref:LPS assembly outer membrane protein LptD (Organic solvent tolerance protein OstA) n=1 Tax=Saccharicrinis carchari TaxID=1168039 RepID=A0A521ASV8_SACCC|nr:putative LPS assembly protein LptD [Saccharicrinis carchari]SMO37948.1 LPS assembly outer membrane protein LptD (organic solvent tolerance protein OstA) [Saccharicrinis carchari]